MKIRFLCGCETGNVENRENLLTMDSIVVDDEGMLTCAIHGARRYGWRSIPRSDNHPGQKHAYFSLTPAQIEGRILFKDPFPLPQPLFVHFEVPDLRDNRDPARVIIKTYKRQRIKELAELDGNNGNGLALLERNRREQ